jgi:hypothetical protein
MFPHVVLPLFLLLAGAAASVASAAPSPRIGEAEVRERDQGLPCFTITEREEQRGAPNFQAVAVYDISAKSRVRMWAMALPPDRTFPVLFSMCVPYGGRVQSLPQTASKPLQPGRMYEVFIDVRRDGKANRPLVYSARFCLAKRPDGGMALHPPASAARPGPNREGCANPK